MPRIWKQFRIEMVALILFALGVFFLVEDYDIRETLYAWVDSFWNDGRDLARRAYRAARTQYNNTSMSDLIGIAMVVAAVLFVTWRLRWHMIHAEYWTRRACPVCGGPIARIHRTPWDRLIGSALALPLYRYLCRNPECRWNGRRYGSHRLHQIHPGEFQETQWK